jgi:hypothetical protein
LLMHKGLIEYDLHNHTYVITPMSKLQNQTKI